MKPQLWALAAAVWTALYLAAYIAGVHGQESGVFLTYGAMVLLAGLLVLPTGIQGPSLRRANLMLAALVIYVLITLWGTLGSGPFGLLLVPAAAATARALSLIRRGAAPTETGPNRR